MIPQMFVDASEDCSAAFDAPNKLIHIPATKSWMLPNCIKLVFKSCRELICVPLQRP